MKEYLPYLNTLITLGGLLVAGTMYVGNDHNDISVIKRDVAEINLTLKEHVKKTEGVHEDIYKQQAQMNNRIDKLELQAFKMPKDHTAVAFLSSEYK
jgi:hypothetical protein